MNETQTNSPPDDRLQKLLNEVEEFLVINFPIAVERRKFTEPIYGMILIYTGVDSDMTGSSPPFLLPSVRFREQVERTERPMNWSYMLWSACEIRGLPGVFEAWCDDPTLTEKLEQIFELTIEADGEYEPVRRMFQRVCRRLNRIDWAKILPITDDFIVIASDDHGEMTETPDDYISAEKLSLLKQRGRIN